ncbi:MAG: argininosuccinate lyase [Leptospiraceae bacterium]|nr:argininosuccinate lyase [Leptospiraceae bacterium]
MDKKENSKLWGGRFASPTSPVMERIGESISFDHNLYKQDIEGSKAHAKNLLKLEILTNREYEDILSGLDKIKLELESGKLPFKAELEDIHMHIESRLTELIGQAGKKLHTGRSRNDQVCQDVRLYIRDSTNQIKEKIKSLLETLYQKAESSIDMVMPGYTHLQVAQPIRISHYLLSYFWSFYRDYKQFEFSESVNNSLVLGSGALAGVNYKTDRKLIADELSFSHISENSIDAVSSRDHIFNYLFAISQMMTHFSRICEEIIIYSSVEFQFLKLPDSLTTGSSIMPQKKNPDIAELIRGKSARVISALNHAFILVKGLPLAYNRDLQEDKIPLFDATEQILISIEGIEEMIRGMDFLPENTVDSLKKGFATATDLADFLVSEKKVPFREAHELTGKLVNFCVENKITLFDVEEKDRKEISEYFSGEEYFEAISLFASTEKKDVEGGTAKNRQLEQLEKAKLAIESL